MYAEEDSKKKESIEVKNNADSMIYQAENTLKEVEGKIGDDDKKKVEDAVAALKEVKDSDDIDAIKAKTEELTQAFYAISEKLYQENAAQGNPGEADGSEENVTDADYEVVDEDEDQE